MMMNTNHSNSNQNKKGDHSLETEITQCNKSTDVKLVDPSTDLRSPNIDNIMSERQSLKPAMNNHILNTIKTPYIPSMLSFINNKTFWARIFIMFITIFICWLSSCYTIKQILSLTISKYWCDYKSLQEIRQHSKQNNLPHGSTSCWSAKDFTVQLLYDILLRAVVQSLS